MEWQPEYVHVHRHDDEARYMLEGRMIFSFPYQDEPEIEVGPGETVFVPARVPHTCYEADGPTRSPIILTPRLNELVDELTETPRSKHGKVLRQYRSEIIA